MMHERTTLTRDELYDLVWQKPILRLAEDFNITNVGLAKLCARHGITTPPRGYWAKVAAGHTPPKPKLPPSPNGAPIRLRLKQHSATPGASEQSWARAIDEIRKPENRIRVAAALRAPRNLVSEAKSLLTNSDANHLGIVQPTDRCLDIRVSRKQLSRALRIADALLKAFGKRGWDVTLGQGTTDVIVGSVAISLTIEEELESVEVAPEIDLESDYYNFHYDRSETVRRPSGRLKIGIQENHRLWFHNQQRNWRCSNTAGVEERLNSVLIGILKLADAVKQDIANKEREARDAEERQRELENTLNEQRRLRSAIEDENQRVKQLFEHAARWRTAQELRAFIARAQNQGCLPEIALEGDEFERWAMWAQEQADRLDPLTPRPASILDEEEQLERRDHDPGGWR